ncbi:TFIIB-type zinc ribbon-containing protein [Campylobacter concisus]|jgi:hypothetical protein cfetvA_06693|uniref:TFIIB-type zinc ribbon-containing protein n=1 Tax=Campylobacter concisus TaxID=199 RepID=UPI001E33301A|nr:hypothetical protein [Campylobacter concisus]DAS49372.1 MAG TPA: antitoxin [Caudoviricetes sp.]DAS95253.1 MAG TPA: antitoxin [Caudoviricetes sp.]
MYKCPNCGSSSIKKERIYVEEAGREIDTGDRICQDCGFVGTSNEFNRDIYDQELDDEISDHPNLHIPKENLIKATCKELNLTYKQLGEMIGYGEGAIKNSASTGNVSEPMAHAIKMYKRILELERDIADSEAVKENLKKWLK